MTLGWQATRRCILCTLATRLFHHLPTLKKIPLKITPQAQLVLISPFVTITTASQRIPRNCSIARYEVRTVSKTTRSERIEATSRIAIRSRSIIRTIIRILWTICKDRSPRTTSTIRWTVPLNWDIKRAKCIIRNRRRRPGTVRSHRRGSNHDRALSKAKLRTSPECSPITSANNRWDRFTLIPDWQTRVNRTRTNKRYRTGLNVIADLCPCTPVIFKRINSDPLISFA